MDYKKEELLNDLKILSQEIDYEQHEFFFSGIEFEMTCVDFDEAVDFITSTFDLKDSNMSIINSNTKMIVRHWFFSGI
jgi:hypothetical protein